MVRRLGRLLSPWLTAAGLAICGAPPAASDVCTFPTAIRVDVAITDTFVDIFDCRGFGQVFLASDSLIESISIWRPSDPALDGQPRHLFILETRAGDDRVPDLTRLVLDAGELVAHDGDGIHAVEYRWVFDPPFALPHRGRFFFDILAPDFTFFWIPAVTTDPYPDGEAWNTSPTFNCDRPGGLFPGMPPHLDLAFEVRFCATGATPTREGSWGRLKLIYR